MSEPIRFGDGVWSYAEISPERRTIYAEADNLQLKAAMMAIVEAADSANGARLMKQLALFALARSAMP